MGRVSKKALQIFKKWGQKGGKVRAERLSPHKRSTIAANAARSRWNKQSKGLPPALLPSVRLEEAELNDPVYLEEMLSEGTWADWKILYKAVSDRPFGETAAVVERVCSSVKMYGVSALWQNILRTVRGGAE